MCTPLVQRVIVLHHPFRVTALFGQQSEFEGHSFGLIGDVIENQIPTLIDFPMDLFDPPAPAANNVTVMTVEALHQYYVDYPNEEWMPAEIPNDQQQVVRVWKGEMVPFLIDRPLRPRDAFLQVLMHLEAQGLVETCRPLVDWLVATCKHKVFPAPAADALPVVQPPPTATTCLGYFLRTPIAVELVQIVLGKMRQELPGFATQQAPQPAFTMGDLEAMGHAVVDALTSLSTAQARPVQASVTTPADFYGSNLGVLMR
jgi:hypothetical protein